MKLINLSSTVKCLFVFLLSAASTSLADVDILAPTVNAPAANEKDKKSSDSLDESRKVIEPNPNLAELCINELKQFPGNINSKSLSEVCKKTMALSQCQSVNGTPIFHFERKGKEEKPKKILAFSLIHGDETHAGSVGRYWMERLEEIEPRNHWRVIPVLNPDGVKEKTRYNANKIDLNRNFPTKDWDELAQKYWKLHTQSSPRRFPGSQSGSEPEIKCALQHIEDFKPDFIISIHTPLNVLDFDGPKVPAPKFGYLPWKSLGHFPGSLGRYMWYERSVPVLTMELKTSLPKTNQPFEVLQDLIGTLVKYDMR